MFVRDAARVACAISRNITFAGYEIPIDRLRIPRIHGSMVSGILGVCKVDSCLSCEQETTQHWVAVWQCSGFLRDTWVLVFECIIISPFYCTKKVHIFERWREVLIPLWFDKRVRVFALHAGNRNDLCFFHESSLNPENKSEEICVYMFYTVHAHDICIFNSLQQLVKILHHLTVTSSQYWPFSTVFCVSQVLGQIRLAVSRVSWDPYWRNQENRVGHVYPYAPCMVCLRLPWKPTICKYGRYTIHGSYGLWGWHTQKFGSYKKLWSFHGWKKDLRGLGKCDLIRCLSQGCPPFT